MGICFSATTTTAAAIIDETTAKVVSADGSLIEYSSRVRVSQVLGIDSLSSFLCNSDSLCYDTYILASLPDDFIRLGDLYFVLPIDKLEHILSSSDMAALAITAASALANVSKIRRPSPLTSNVRVIPVAEEVDGTDVDEFERLNEDSVGFSSLRRCPRLVQKQTRRSRGKIVHRRKLSAVEELAEWK